METTEPTVLIDNEAFSRGSNVRSNFEDSPLVRRLKSGDVDTSVSRSKQRRVAKYLEQLSALYNSDLENPDTMHPLIIEHGLQEHMKYLALNFDSKFGQMGDILDQMEHYEKIGKPTKMPGYALFADSLAAVRQSVSLIVLTNQNVALISPTQSGKTIMETMLTIILRHYMAEQGIPAMVKLVPYGRKGVELETMRDLAAAASLHRTVHLEGALETFGDHTSLTQEDSMKNLTMLRTSLNFCRRTVEEAVKKGAKELVLILDEADHASNLHGVLDQFKALCKDAGIGLRWILVSATPWEYADTAGCSRVVVTKLPGSGYRGLVQGDPLAVHSFNQLAAALDVPFLNSFTIKEGIARINDFAKLIASFAKGVYAPAVNLNGLPFNGKRCMAIRYGTGAVTEKMAADLPVRLACLGAANVVVATHYGDDLRKDGRPQRVADSVEAALADQPEGTLCVVLLKGTGRRADRFEGDDFALFIDATPKFSTAESFYQGLIGRATGYKGPETTVFVSEANHDMVEQIRYGYRVTGIETPPLKLQRSFTSVDGRRISTSALPPVSKYRVRLDQLPNDLREEITASIAQNLIPLIKVTRLSSGRRYDRLLDRGVQPNDMPFLLNTMTVAQAIENGIVPTGGMTPDSRNLHYLHNIVDCVFGGIDNFNKLERCIAQHFMNDKLRLLKAGDYPCDYPGSENPHFYRSFVKSDKGELVDTLKVVKATKDGVRVPYPTYANTFSPISVGNVARSGQGGLDRADRETTVRGAEKDNHNAKKVEVLFRIDEQTLAVTPEEIEVRLYGECQDHSRLYEVSEAQNLPMGSTWEDMADSEQQAAIQAERIERGRPIDADSERALRGKTKPLNAQPWVVSVRQEGLHA